MYRKSLRYGILLVLLGMLTSRVLAQPHNNRPDYSKYARVLETYVDGNGMVDYKKLKANPQELKAFLEMVSGLRKKDYEALGDEDRIAFWINAYNAFTLKVIIDNYPIRASWIKSRIYPKSSIKQISGVWDRLKWDVMGEKMTLSHIEHQVLRGEFNEPRIHMALVCAAISCPPLRNEPYEGSRLGEQLNDQARKFLINPMKFKINRGKKKVFLSPIFKWFAEDFKRGYGGITIFVSRYLDASDAQYLKKERYRVSYLKYDWSLNEQ